MNYEGYKFDWEDVVHVVKDAPIMYRPMGVGVIVGMRTVQSEKEAKGEHPLGSVLFLVEFGDNGETIEMSEAYLRAGAS